VLADRNQRSRPLDLDRRGMSARPTGWNFTVIGPAVNLAFGLEGLTKELRRPVLASRAFAEAAGPAAREPGFP
jgi:class 3 adenylate cyclase